MEKSRRSRRLRLPVFTIVIVSVNGARNTVAKTVQQVHGTSSPVSDAGLAVPPVSDAVPCPKDGHLPNLGPKPRAPKMDTCQIWVPKPPLDPKPPPTVARSTNFGRNFGSDTWLTESHCVDVTFCIRESQHRTNNGGHPPHCRAGPCGPACTSFFFAFGWDGIGSTSSPCPRSHLTASARASMRLRAHAFTSAKSSSNHLWNFPGHVCIRADVILFCDVTYLSCAGTNTEQLANVAASQRASKSSAHRGSK